MDKIYKLYAHLFGRVIFLKLNRFLYHLSLRGFKLSKRLFNGRKNMA